MTALLDEYSEAIPPTEADTRLAQESCRQLARILNAKSKRSKKSPSPLRIQLDDGTQEPFSIPMSAFSLLKGILTEMAKGNAVTLIPVHTELTTQQAADLIHVSRPFLIEQMEKGHLQHRKVGTHRRVLFQDLMDYKQKVDGQRIEALEELSGLDQQLGLGY